MFKHKMKSAIIQFGAFVRLYARMLGNRLEKGGGVVEKSEVSSARRVVLLGL